MKNDIANKDGGKSTEDDSASAEGSCATTEEDNSDMRWGQLDKETILMQKERRLDWSKWFGDRSHN